MKNENIQPLHNASVVPSIASEFGEKNTNGENSLHTSPDGGTIPALCKVGGTGELEKTFIYNGVTYNKKDFPKFPPLSNEEKKMGVTRAYIVDNENGKFIVHEEFLYPLTVV